MTDTFEFTLDEESEKKLFEIMTEFNTEKIPSFTITDKYGNTAEYVKVVRCKHCVYKKICKWYYHSGDDYGFCNWAERNDNDKT